MKAKIAKGQIWVFKSRPQIEIWDIIKGYVVCCSLEPANKEKHPWVYSLDLFQETFVDALKGQILTEVDFHGWLIMWDETDNEWVAAAPLGGFTYLSDAEQAVKAHLNI